jgi:peptide/nickel transport system substrate-binding protein
VILLTMDQSRDELAYSSVKGRNPFKDARVRKAFYQAIDIQTIDAKIMRGMATPVALPMAPQLFPRAGDFKRHAYDVAAARKLMAEAGYGAGFDLVMDCPNDRYVNDEAICQAIAQMLSRIDVRVKLNALPKARYFEKIGPVAKYDSSFNLIGWTPTSLDGWNVLQNLVACRDDGGKRGSFNFGGYCNPKVDDLARKILVERNPEQRDRLMAEAFGIVHDEVGVIPLHQQALSWGIQRSVSIAQRADNHILLYWARKE